MRFMVTGKIPDSKLPSFSWQTGSDIIFALDHKLAEKKFKEMHPEYTDIFARPY
jgi:hypothetical protein